MKGIVSTPDSLTSTKTRRVYPFVFIANDVELQKKADILFKQSLEQVNHRVLRENSLGCIMSNEFAMDEFGYCIDGIPKRMKAMVQINNNPIKIMVNDMLVDRSQGREPDVFFYHSDHLGSASWITDHAGDAVQHLQYLPYGEPYVNQRLSGYNERFTFTGKERDAETGYGYFGARYLDHELMTMWLSVDPMADKYPGISPYAYCAWNPVKLIDPDGKEIHLTFYGKSTISIFNSIIEKGLGNQFKASYSKNSDGSYTFSLKTTEGGGDISKLNKYQKAFYEELSDCIKGTDVANIEIVSGLSSVHIGNYRNNQVDIADVQQFDDIGKGLCTKQGKLIHEFREQYQKACLGYRKGEDNEYNSCHQYAIISENHVNGSRRGKETYAQGIVSQQYSNGGHVSTYSYSTQKPLLNPTKNAILKVRKY